MEQRREINKFDYLTDIRGHLRQGLWCPTLGKVKALTFRRSHRRKKPRGGYWPTVKALGQIANDHLDLRIIAHERDSDSALLRIQKGEVRAIAVWDLSDFFTGPFDAIARIRFIVGQGAVLVVLSERNIYVPPLTVGGYWGQGQYARLDKGAGAPPIAASENAAFLNHGRVQK